jgi:squalene synthase HpnC
MNLSPIEALSEYGPDAPIRPAPSLAEAQSYCRQLAHSHYENFTVVSGLLPRRLRQPFCNVYAYCRWADDLADEAADPVTASRLLDWWESLLCDCCVAERVASLRHPVFIALADTIRQFQIPSEPFRDLISAFRQDQRVTRYASADDVLDYCRRSANPVGRIVLALGRVEDPESCRLSDHICTGLQLANFCQDVARDWDRGRIYLPQQVLRAAGYTEEHFARREFNAGFRSALKTEVDRAEEHLRLGQALAHRVPAELRFDVALFAAGGLAILDAIRQQDYNVWSRRPALGKADKLRIAARCWLRPSSPNGVSASLKASYAHCRRVAIRSASNFVWAFCLLPKPKRKAMYALYAFLRKTDDLGDTDPDPRQSREAIDAWRASFERALNGRCDDPILPALIDSVRRYSIPPEHLFAAIDGVAMDCVPFDPHVSRFASFAELEQYCEHVASAVGMACIHVWGFRDSAAIEPARQCGIAFQLTNILRDLKQDAEQGRIYLPAEDFQRFDYSPDELRRGVRDERFAALMRFEIARAEEHYRRGAALQAYLNPAGRRVFGTMLATYGGLLERIRRMETEVLVSRARLSRWQKLRIAGRWLFLPRMQSGPPRLPRTTRGAVQ